MARYSLEVVRATALQSARLSLLRASRKVPEMRPRKASRAVPLLRCSLGTTGSRSAAGKRRDRSITVAPLHRGAQDATIVLSWNCSAGGGV